MTTLAEAQARVIDDARVAWHGAVSALDEAQRQAEILNEAHLMHESDFWEALGVIGGMTTLLTELIEVIGGMTTLLTELIEVLDELEDP